MNLQQGRTLPETAMKRFSDAAFQVERKVRGRALAGGTQCDHRTSVVQCERDIDYGSQG